MTEDLRHRAANYAANRRAEWWALAITLIVLFGAAPVIGAWVG